MVGEIRGQGWDNPCPSSLSWPPLQWSESCGELIISFYGPPGPEQAEMAPLWEYPQGLWGSHWEVGAAP